MADLDTILVCERCLHPVEGSTTCPKCHADTKQTPALLLQSLRRLRAKGWIMERWKLTPIVKKKMMNCELRLCFHLFAPPPIPDSRCHPELINSVPIIVCSTVHEVDMYANLSRWTQKIPCFVMPFGQGLCDKCISQGADWFFSRVHCPIVKSELGGSEFHRFADEPPYHCAYRVEQVMTMPDRYAELKAKGFFDKNPIAGRKCAKWMMATKV